MSRYKGRMSAVTFDRTWPYTVPIRSDLARGRDDIATMANSLGAAPERRDVVFGDRWHTCFCFATPEAAQALADAFGAEVKDARNRINKGTWQIWEEARPVVNRRK